MYKRQAMLLCRFFIFTGLAVKAITNNTRLMYK